MPARFDDEDDWILVERRGGHRKYRWQDRDRRNEDYGPVRHYRSEYPSPESRKIEKRREGGCEEQRGGRACSDPRDRPPREDGGRMRQNGWMWRQDQREDRNINRRRHFDTAPRQRSRPQTDRIQSNDPDFLQKVRIIHKLIKSVHHLNNLTQKDYPPSLRKMTQILGTFVKPAMPNQDTQTLIEQNAKNWTETTVAILQEHYNLNVENHVQILSQLSAEDWRPPFEIAASWARRNLGRRLTAETLEQTQAVIVAKMADFRATQDSTESNRRERLVTAQIHAPPPSQHKTFKTATTMTEPQVNKDLSTNFEENNDEESFHSELDLEHPQKTAEEEPTTPPSSPDLQICTPTRHPNTSRKHLDWNLHFKQKIVIMGDSNVSRLPSFAAEDVQIDSLPEAKWCHVEGVLNRATTEVDVEKLVLSFGLGNKSQKDKRSPVAELRRALETAQELFPETCIFIPVVNFSTGLPHREQRMLQHLNSFITGLKNHIPALPQDQFSTERDQVHWTRNTAINMLQHWNDYVNLTSP